MATTYADSDTCTECWGIVPPDGVTMVEEDGQLCTCPLDVWLRIPDGEEESEAEANTYRELNRFYVAWYLTAVGLVTRVYFDTYAEARAFLEQEGFQDFTS